MNNFTDLASLLEQWGALSNAEGAAILAQDWNGLARCHAAKDLLQTRIDGVHHVAAFAQSPAGRAVVGRLIAQEEENAAALAKQRQDAEHQRSESQATRRHLRQIHGAYGSRQSTRWQSYS